MNRRGAVKFRAVRPLSSSKLRSSTAAPVDLTAAQLAAPCAGADGAREGAEAGVAASDAGRRRSTRTRASGKGRRNPSQNGGAERTIGFERGCERFSSRRACAPRGPGLEFDHHHRRRKRLPRIIFCIVVLQAILVPRLWLKEEVGCGLLEIGVLNHPRARVTSAPASCPTPAGGRGHDAGCCLFKILQDVAVRTQRFSDKLKSKAFEPLDG